MMKHRALLLSAVFLIAAAPNQPVMRPTRDVKILYQIQPPGMAKPISQFQYWNVAHQKLRIDLPSGGTETLVDLKTNQVQLVRADLRTITSIPGSPTPPENPDLTRGTTQTIAGLSCTNWTGKDGATICLTDDGVLLQATAHGAVLTQAAEVAYVPQPDGLFIPPSDFTVTQAPSNSPAH